MFDAVHMEFSVQKNSMVMINLVFDVACYIKKKMIQIKTLLCLLVLPDSLDLVSCTLGDSIVYIYIYVLF